MSEYIEIENEPTDDPDVMILHTNLPLAIDGVEQYNSLDEMEEGSPVAQALAMIEGIAQLEIEDGQLTITRDPLAEWYYIVADVSAALKDFFL